MRNWIAALAILISTTLASHAQTADAITVGGGLMPGDATTAPKIPVSAALCEACSSGFDFSNVPPALRGPVRAGWFSIPPSGPGYYSAYDQLMGHCRESAPKFPLPPFLLSTLPFYDLDYRYIEDPKYTPDAMESLKRIKFGDHWMLSTGGQAWMRYENLYNARLGEKDNIYTLYRARPFVDLWYEDKFRVFVEGMFANSVWQDLHAGPNDIVRNDFQNLFVEAKLFTWKDRPVYARVGRQEVQLGSQRLIATPDWANARQTFDGIRLLRNGEKWDSDLFWISPRVTTNINGLNSHDNNINIFGGWATRKVKPGTTRDLYFLLTDNTNAVAQQGITRAPYTNYTFGGRAAGDIDGGFLYDFEAAIQLGTHNRENIIAGMATAGVGYHWAQAPLNPVAWINYDYASGDPDPNSGGSYNTFNQLFPFGHYYFGWIDVVGRQNIHDVSASAWLYPAKWLTIWTQFHNFWLASRKDALYNVAGVPIRRDATGKAGNYVGSELDLILNFHLTKRADVLTGYSYLWGGEFLKNTVSPTNAVNSSLFYLSYSYRW